MTDNHPFYWPIDSNNMYLNCHTYYSLNYGVLSETELLELARSHGV